ncbi:hypothetical protein AHF37_02009 [Paragonimus kellicotti]|nr:hypothetical protein AHF37_02009 [Paragonimus kellicotti]
MESFSEQSICVDHVADSGWSLKQHNGQSLNLDDFGASCHEHECHPEKGLTLRFGNYTVVCPFAGGNIRINFQTALGQLSGHIYCPPYSSVCEGTFRDSFNHSDEEELEDLVTEEEMMEEEETQTQEPTVSTLCQPGSYSAGQSKDRFTLSTTVIQSFAYVMWIYLSRACP